MRLSLGTMQIGGELSKLESFELLNYYFERYHNAKSKKLVDILYEFCESFNLNLVELSYRYLLNNPSVSEIIIGTKNIKQTNMALKFIEKGKLPN